WHVSRPIVVGDIPSYFIICWVFHQHSVFYSSVGGKSFIERRYA
ncbi:MAG: hypothetical protein ACI9C4_002587, partial [Paraglaciecola sp.]